MKNVKSDTKYIIKRILIGVGITLILFNLKKCNVYAYSSVQTYQLSTDTVQATWLYSSSDISSCNKNANQFISFEYNDIKYNLCYYNDAPYKNFTPGVVVFEYHNELYVAPGSYDSSFGTPDYIDIHPDNSNVLIFRLHKNNSSSRTALYAPFLPNIFFAGQYFKNFIKLVPENIPVNSTQVLSRNDFVNNISDIQIVYNSLNIPVYFNNNIEIPEKPNDPLANYTKVDLTGYQAILLVPKNYPYLLSEYGFESEKPNANNPQIHYNIGYEKCVKPTLIELNNFKNFSINTTLNSDPTSEYELNSYCSDTPELYTQDYPIYNIRAEEQPNYYYMGILVYNNSTDYSQNTPDWINNQQNPYGQSFVYVEEEFYNYYLVENFSTFNQSLSYKDFNLEDKTTNINSLPTFNGLVDGSLSSIDTPLGQNMNFQYFLDFVKFPFNFLKSFITGTCEPITLPLPYLGNMQLPCMSTIYSQFIPASLINLLSIVINGLLFWRFTLSNIHSLQDILQPEDTELEVWSL